MRSKPFYRPSVLLKFILGKNVPEKFFETFYALFLPELHLHIQNLLLGCDYA